MTHQKDFKKLVRARMRKTGESYTTSRSQLLRKKTDAAAKPLVAVATARRTAKPALDVSKAGMSDAKIREKTGKTWSEWTAALDAIGAERMPHRDIATYVNETMGIDGWWSQTITVGYERIRGLRDVGQRRGGNYEVSKSKTCPVPLAKLYHAFADTRTRKKWLPVAMTIRTATANKSMRVTWEDGTSVQLMFYAKDASRSFVAVQHAKLASRADADRVRAFWTERLEALSALFGKPAPARRRAVAKKRG